MCTSVLKPGAQGAPSPLCSLPCTGFWVLCLSALSFVISSGSHLPCWHFMERGHCRELDTSHHHVRAVLQGYFLSNIPLPAIQLFSPWLNHLKIDCSHPSSSCFVCMSRKGNLGFCCNAIHNSLLESITLISSYCTPKKTEKNKNKGEPSMWLLCLAASRLLRKSAWLLRAFIRSIFVNIPKMAWVLSS